MIPDQLGRDLRRRLRGFQSRHRVPAVAAGVLLDGALAWTDAVGLARIAPDEPVGVEHQFRIGSITKTFTAVAVMQLRDDGLVALADPLSRHVPEAPRGVTIERLLSHLSGLQRETPGHIWETLEVPSREELLARLEDVEHVLPAGERFHYSNLAFALLGELVERVRDAPYERVVQQRILDPLGLARTSFEPAEPHAHGYLVRPYTDEVDPERLVRLRGDASAGQLWSTVADLARWASFMCEPDATVLRPESVEEMHLPRAFAGSEPLRTAYGLGIMMTRAGERLLAGHGGAMPGFLAELGYVREHRAGAVVLANTTANAPCEELVEELLDQALEAVPPAPREWRPAPGPPEELRGGLGRWWAEGEEWVFSWHEGRLEARSAGDPRGRPAVFAPDGPDRFRVVSGREHGEPLELARDEAGRITRMYWATYPLTRAAEPFGGPARGRRS